MLSEVIEQIHSVGGKTGLQPEYLPIELIDALIEDGKTFELITRLKLNRDPTEDEIKSTVQYFHLEQRDRQMELERQNWIEKRQMDIRKN